MKKVAFAIVSLVALSGCSLGGGGGLSWLHEALQHVTYLGELITNFGVITGAAT